MYFLALVTKEITFVQRVNSEVVNLVKITVLWFINIKLRRLEYDIKITSKSTLRFTKVGPS